MRVFSFVEKPIGSFKGKWNFLPTPSFTQTQGSMSTRSVRCSHWNLIYIHAFLYKQRFFSSQPQYCLTFSWIELQMLLMCCLIHMTIIILRHFLYFLYWSPCLNPDLFMSYLWDLFVFFVIISIIINKSHEYRHICSFAYFLEYALLFLDGNVDEKCE